MSLSPLSYHRLTRVHPRSRMHEHGVGHGRRVALILSKTRYSGSGAVTLGGLTAAGVGQDAVGGSGAVTLGALTCSGTGSVITGSGAVTLGALACSGSGTHGTTAGSGAVTLGSLVLEGVGYRFLASPGGNPSLQPLEIVGIGKLSPGPRNIPVRRAPQPDERVPVARGIITETEHRRPTVGGSRRSAPPGVV